MQNFELLRNVTIGQYIATGSPVHRLDPRVKLLGAAALILAVSFSTSILANLLFLGAVLVIARASRISFAYLLRGFILGLPLLVLIFVMQFLFLGRVEPAGEIYFEWSWFRITHYSLHLIAVSLLRLTSFIFLTSLVTMTATITEIAHGVELILRPFRRVGVPAHELSLVLTIALRFVPALAEELERILKAQAGRGADIGSNRYWRPDKAARAYLPMIVPLFMGAFRRAEDLIMAMEARGYVSGAQRSSFVVLQSAPRDWLALAGALSFAAAILFVRWPSVREIGQGIGVWLGLLA